MSRPMSEHSSPLFLCSAILAPILHDVSSNRPCNHGEASLLFLLLVPLT